MKVNFKSSIFLNCFIGILKTLIISRCCAGEKNQTPQKIIEVRQCAVIQISKCAYSGTSSTWQTPFLQKVFECLRVSLWCNRLARSAVNRKVGGSSPPRDVAFWSRLLN